MKFKIPLEGGEDEINMAPMIDMVFLLLIFFMVATQMVKVERIEVELPVADEAVVPDAVKDRTTITIRSEDTTGEDVEIFVFTSKDPVSIENVSDLVREQYTANNNIKVYLRADRYVKHKHVKEVMAACAEAGVADVIFATFEAGN